MRVHAGGEGHAEHSPLGSAGVCVCEILDGHHHPCISGMKCMGGGGDLRRAGGGISFPTFYEQSPPLPSPHHIPSGQRVMARWGLCPVLSPAHREDIAGRGLLLLLADAFLNEAPCFKLWFFWQEQTLTLSPQRKVPFLPGYIAASHHSKGKGGDL